MAHPVKSQSRIKFSDNASSIFRAEKVGVSLGPGWPMGLVGLGLLIALKQLRIPVSLISGSSMGAIISALYASGLPPEEIRKGAMDLFATSNVRKYLKEDIKFPVVGLSTAERLVQRLVEFTGWDPEFHELMIPLYIAAADKVSQKNVIINHGRVFDAVRASLSMPLIVKKQPLGGMRLADGAIFSPLNVDILYQEGADFVIAIQAKPIRSVNNRKLLLNAALINQSLKLLGWKVRENIYGSNPACEILLRPRIPKAWLSDDSKIDRIIDLGVKITYEALQKKEKSTSAISSLLHKFEKTKMNTRPSTEPFDFDKQFEKVKNYFDQVKIKTEKMSDAQLSDEFLVFKMEFLSFLNKISKKYSDSGPEREQIKEKLKMLKVHVDESPFMKRCLDKPFGYAGDFTMMNYIYDDNVYHASTNMGKLLNYYLFSDPAANAVRNRANIVVGLLQQKLTELDDIHITSIACGSAREVGTTFKLIPKIFENKNLTWTLLDQEIEALDYIKKQKFDFRNLELNLVQAGVRNILKKETRIENQDLIYSLGLFDYLDDEISVRLMSELYEGLNPGGVLLIGNFKDHPLRSLMEGVLDWYLIYRTEEEFLALGKKAIPQARHFVISEPGGINLILVSTKPVQQ